MDPSLSQYQLLGDLRSLSGDGTNSLPAPAALLSPPTVTLWYHGGSLCVFLAAVDSVGSYESYDTTEYKFEIPDPSKTRFLIPQ